MSSANVVERVFYNEVAATKTMRAVPRFGHSSNFSQVFAEDPNSVGDYVAGLVFVAGFLLALFLIWWIAILVLKCIPKSGFLGGARFTNPKRAKRVRIVYVIFLLLWIVFTVLLVTMGITNLQDTVGTLAQSNQDVNAIVKEANRIASNLQEVGDRSVSIRNTLVANLDNLCPNSPDLAASLGIDIEAEAQTAVSLLRQLSNFVKNELQDAQSGLENIEQTTNDVDATVKQIELHDWQALIILIPWIMVPSFLLVGVFMALLKVSMPIYDCIQRWFFFPLLVIMTITSMVLACVVSAGAVANADFCSGGSQQTPDGTVFDILEATGVNQNELVFRVVRFYVTQCLAEDPFAFISDYRDQIEQADVSVKEFDFSIEAVGISRLQELCGESVLDVASLTGVMLENLALLRESAADTVDLLRCDNIVPIYTATVYNGTCTFSVKGITWTFAAFLVVAFMGMFLVMFRSSFQADDEEFIRDGQSKSMANLGEPAENYYVDDDYYGGPSAPAETFSHSYTGGEEYDNAQVINENGLQSQHSYPFEEHSYAQEGNAVQLQRSYTYPDENGVEAQYAAAFADTNYRESVDAPSSR